MGAAVLPFTRNVFFWYLLAEKNRLCFLCVKTRKCLQQNTSQVIPKEGSWETEPEKQSIIYFVQAFWKKEQVQKMELTRFKDQVRNEAPNIEKV